MKVLFVSGGITEKFGIPPLIKAQGESLKNNNIEVCYFPIEGKGLKGYLWHISKLKKQLKENPVDIIHAHFSFAGVVASLTFTKTPIVVSLLGTDVYGRSIIKKIIILFRKLFSWDALIVKSSAMNNIMKGDKGLVIPNGVNISLFKPINSNDCKNKLFWDPSIKHILFAANPKRPEKNFALAEKTINLLSDNSVCLHELENIDHKDIPIWLNASNVVLLTSFWEGSPNVIKEAMACNRPIVCTNVGDVEWLFGKSPGHFITSFCPDNVSKKMLEAVEYSEKSGKTNGRERILELGLDSGSVANLLVKIYEQIQK